MCLCSFVDSFFPGMSGCWLWTSWAAPGEQGAGAARGCTPSLAHRNQVLQCLCGDCQVFNGKLMDGWPQNAASYLKGYITLPPTSVSCELFPTFLPEPLSCHLLWIWTGSSIWVWFSAPRKGISEVLLSVETGEVSDDAKCGTDSVPELSPGSVSAGIKELLTSRSCWVGEGLSPFLSPLAHLNLPWKESKKNQPEDPLKFSPVSSHHVMLLKYQPKKWSVPIFSLNPAARFLTLIFNFRKNKRGKKTPRIGEHLTPALGAFSRADRFFILTL